LEPSLVVAAITTLADHIGIRNPRHTGHTVEIGPIKVVAREIHKKNFTRIDHAVGKSVVAAIADDVNRAS